MNYPCLDWKELQALKSKMPPPWFAHSEWGAWIHELVPPPCCSTASEQDWENYYEQIARLIAPRSMNDIKRFVS
ncbi:MAG: hypothetical protein F6J93_37740 [Oscillatoria sp. SIO1A7]|nr:hypothetical protein [Oscillatoria sp. SIO1A7]